MAHIGESRYPHAVEYVQLERKFGQPPAAPARVVDPQGTVVRLSASHQPSGKAATREGAPPVPRASVIAAATSVVLAVCAACGTATAPDAAEQQGDSQSRRSAGDDPAPAGARARGQEPQLQCSSDVYIAGEPTSIDVGESDLTPQEIGDIEASARPNDQDVTSTVEHQDKDKATVVLRRDDGTVNTILTVRRNPGYGWALSRIESCTSVK